MRVLIVALGTMGDVAPYTGLAAPLRAAGHEVAIAAFPRFAELVRACGAEFREIAGDPAAAGGWTQAENSSRALRSVTAQTLELGESVLAVAKDGIDVLLLSMPAQAGMYVAESLGIPSMGLFLQPLFPTAAHPPSFLGTGGSLGSWGNRAAGHLVLGLMGRLAVRGIRELRARLGLPPATRRELGAQMDAWTVLHAYSPSVLPRPVDWRAGLEVSGYLWPAVPPDWRPPADLAGFLDAGPPPVYVGFGSRNIADGARIVEVVEEALRLAGARGVLHAGWAGLASRSDRLLTIGQTPHEWLFPRMAAVVHHCGAGTTAAGLRAGVPTVGVPILGDQPFWAGRVAALGAGPRPVPYGKLSAARLAEAISGAVSDPSYRTAATALSRRVAVENGAGAVVAALDRVAR
ncbi:glycosyl transferase [Sphaerisporangium krabiense]|uniref:UDP:flavonoid glycosyltransferase YjiC (YdhE family) n=1 Tax=Sphaerisporangium krabiense TaxID=763782 RepID=A0A7W8Z4V4_9ACTN|nr:glycosyltransferase [Sphaerisporangium krabiense]MBB5627509.1 UDP:flavonoid glycosyltransferase YjiC (YdhE family) [Sphaerisporangium krabiense]GII66524.1 glycosyl transferase [Sphaerisporangium krabiense]